MTRHRTTLMLAAGVLLSAMLCLYATARLYSAHDAALAAQDELIECSRLGRTLALLKSGSLSRETLASLLPEASAAIREASAQPGVPADTLQVGQPFPGPGASVCLPVRMQAYTLEQLVAFLYRLSSGPAALRIQSLVMTGSPDDASRWDADLTLSCDVCGDLQTEGH